jgi:hypothetical protein
MSKGPTIRCFEDVAIDKDRDLKSNRDDSKLASPDQATLELPHYDYPGDLAVFVVNNWSQSIAGGECNQSASDAPGAAIGAAALEQIISACYQASLLREEARPVTFRVIVVEPDCFPPADGPPTGFHCLKFTQALAFTAHELRRLSPAARFHRSLIGVHSVDGQWQIWGIIHSGPRWLMSAHGGRGTAPDLPPYLVVCVTGPGHVEVQCGSIVLGQLSDGKVFGPSMNVFESQWLQDFFAPIRSERMSLHLAARQQADGTWAELDADLTRIIDQNMMKRLIAAIRAFHHGGTLIFVPPEYADEISQHKAEIYLKQEFVEGEPRARFRTLIVRMMNLLAERGSRKVKSRPVSWEDYERTHDAKVTELDEAIFEMSHLIAGLSTVDGAVVVTKRFELLGFGGEIRCDLSEVTAVGKALDIEGSRLKIESVHGVGTRHRSAYALCHTLKDALVIVISQDGGVRFVKWNGHRVVYWDHQATFTFSSRF